MAVDYPFMFRYEMCVKKETSPADSQSFRGAPRRNRRPEKLGAGLT